VLISDKSAMKNRLKILLTNDDGYDSAGIRHLYGVLSAEHDVVVAAPQCEQSGIGHAFTINRPLHYHSLPVELGMQGYSINGTPSDCVKFAISFLLPQKPDFVVSGMNIGENSGICGYYSGTVAAAREGAFWRVPSIAFSLCSPASDHVEAYCRRALDIFRGIAALRPAQNGRCVFYNVNFPDCAPGACRGVKVTRQSTAFFDDRYRLEGAAPQAGYVVFGDKKDVEALDTFDSRALMNNFITVSPLGFDATAEWALPLLGGLERL
jgi:5'-nucleotidase